MAKTTLEQPVTTPLLIGDRFEVMQDDLLGEGGISQVFRGRDRSTGGPVAAKRLRSEFVDDSEAQWRFEREQRISSVLDHPNVVGYLDARDGWLFLELVDGENLKRTLADRGAFELEEAVRIMRGALAGLDHIHGRGIVHLDVKPQNIMLTRRHRVRLIDLGLAHEFADQQVDRLGTAAYIAPEQIDQAPVDARTDLYALGCVFFELLTGRPPFVAPGLTGAAEQRQLLDAHRYDEVVPPSSLRAGLPMWVDDVVDRALAKAPEHRFASATAMQDAIERGLSGPVRPREVRHVTARQPVAEVPVERPREPGPSTLHRFLGWCLALLMSGVKALAGLPLRFSRRLTILAGTLALIVLLNLPVVSDVLMEQLIDVVPWTGTTVQADGLNLRAEPGTNSEVKAGLGFGSSVSIAGLPQQRDGITWWPVVVDGERGWVAGSDRDQTYLDETGLMWVVQLPDDARDAVGGFVDLLLP